MKYIASISGGKDSVAMCLRLIEEGRKVDAFVFADTGMEFPECYDAINRFEMFSGRKVDRVSADYTMEYLLADKPIKLKSERPQKDGTPRRVNGYGWPSIWRRKCTECMKIRPLMKFKKQFGEYVELVGIAADEPKRIKNDPKKQYPLVEWGMTEVDCLKYCRERGFYQSPCAYDDCNRMSCYFCPMQNLKQVKHLVTKRPELWAEIKRLETRIGEPWKRGTNYYEAKYKGE